MWGQKIDADFLPTVAGTVLGISGRKEGSLRKYSKESYKTAVFPVVT